MKNKKGACFDGSLRGGQVHISSISCLHTREVSPVVRWALSLSLSLSALLNVKNKKDDGDTMEENG